MDPWVHSLDPGAVSQTVERSRAEAGDSIVPVRRLVLELEDDEYKRIELAAFGHSTPAYVLAVVRAVLDYRDKEAEPDANRARKVVA